MKGYTSRLHEKMRPTSVILSFKIEVNQKKRPIIQAIGIRRRAPTKPTQAVAILRSFSSVFAMNSVILLCRRVVFVEQDVLHLGGTVSIGLVIDAQEDTKHT